MKNQNVLSLILFSILLLQTSCICDCRENGGFIKLKLLKDGQNALFGPEASINRDSIKFYLSNLNDPYDQFISYNDSTKTMDVFIGDTRTYILKIDNVRTDTIVGNTVVTGTGQCGCSSFQLIKVTMNGQVLCQDGCEEIIEVQL
ncbi:MAG: hypothetical protein ABJB16_13310 [Saprospiraceae bacterium]